MAMFKKGDNVKVAVQAPAGPVEGFRLDEEGNMQYLISWTDSNGGSHQRWFSEADLVAA